MKKIKLLLFALVLTFLTNTTVLAETRWDTMQPVKQTTSDGIKIEYQTKFEYILDCWYENYCDKIGVDAEVNVTVTIPEDYDKETIVFSPKVYQDLREVLSYNGIQPGDKFTINFKITNKSKYELNNNVRHVII